MGAPPKFRPQRNTRIGSTRRYGVTRTQAPMNDDHKLQALARRGEGLRNELDTPRAKVTAFEIPVKAGPRSQGRLERSLMQLEAEVHAVVAEVHALDAELRRWQQSRTRH
jgi:hypothetical protein